MRCEVMGKKHRLGVLEVRAAGHDCRLVGPRLHNDSPDEIGNVGRDNRRVIEQVQANKRCDLVVSAAPSPKLAAEFSPGALDEQSFERRMHVFVCFGSYNRASLDVGEERIQRTRHLGEFRTRQVASSGERLRM